MPRARNGKSGGYQTRSVSRLGGWVRWIGCAAVWEAGRAVCGERHLEQTQGYSPTATEDDGVGRGDIHTYAIIFYRYRYRLQIQVGRALVARCSLPLALSEPM